MVVARSAGVVDSVLVDLGTRVAAATPLARLESADQELALAQAQAAYENMGRLVSRARVMTKAGGVTVADSEQVEFQYTQAELARRAGMGKSQLSGYENGKELPKLAYDETAVVRFGQEFFRTHRVSRGTFQLALEQLGRQGAIELALFLGNYASLALLVNSFDGDLPPDRKEPLLPV